jgi:hypothetical protein
MADRVQGLNTTEVGLIGSCCVKLAPWRFLSRLAMIDKAIVINDLRAKVGDVGISLLSKVSKTFASQNCQSKTFLPNKVRKPTWGSDMAHQLEY